MRYRPLGPTGLVVSEVGFGCWQLGGRGWGRVRAGEAIHAVHEAIDAGINLFDTAPVYGFGRSEELLARALRGSRDPRVIVTKGGLAWDARGRVRHDNRPEALVRGAEESLARLRRDRIDVLLLHWPDPQVPLAESIGALEDLRRRGKILAWGLSNFPAADVLALDPPPPVLEYPANILDRYAQEYEAAARAGRELIELAPERGWGVIVFDVLMRGLLGGCYDAARAIRDLLEAPGIASCLVGFKNPGQVVNLEY